MSVITFVNNIEEETGKTMSLVAIATNMAIDNNNRILIVSTTNKKDKINDCFFGEMKARKIGFGIFGEARKTLEIESGIEGIAKMSRSNKLTPEIITNYTKVVFKDRLEVLLGTERNGSFSIDEKEIEREYIDIINVAQSYYDKIFVDLDSNLGEETRNKIIELSDIVIVNSSQNYTSLKRLKENKKKSELFRNSKKTLVLIGRYDKFSKYNSKNITRFLEEKNQVLTVPYNTLYFEATNEAEVPDLFLKFKRLYDSEDRNALFIQEIKRASENINYRLQELQAMM